MIEVIKIEENKFRVVRGKLVGELNVDWTTKDLTTLRSLIEFGLAYKSSLPALQKAKYKNLKVHEGANHLDVVDHNVGTLGLLVVEDHFVDEEELRKRKAPVISANL